MPAQSPGGLQPPGKILPRRYPVGAEPLEGDRVAVRVWAPKRGRVSIVFQPGMTGAETGQSDIGRSDMRPVDLTRDGGGYFSAIVDEMPVGSRYGFLLDDDLTPYPDPASRFQPEGPHGPSQVVDASRFGWTDDAWKGRSIEGQVIYEMHIGTFTPEGTWQAALRELPRLAELGLTVLELMPVADFPAASAGAMRREPVRADAGLVQGCRCCRCGRDRIGSEPLPDRPA